jgi:hypothetical protein
VTWCGCCENRLWGQRQKRSLRKLFSWLGWGRKVVTSWTDIEDSNNRIYWFGDWEKEKIGEWDRLQACALHPCMELPLLSREPAVGVGNVNCEMLGWATRVRGGSTLDMGKDYLRVRNAYVLYKKQTWELKPHAHTKTCM